MASKAEPRIQLDATLAGLRPRELDRSARRDLAAILKRLGVRATGLDLYIPPGHFADTSRADRAMGAVLSGIELMGDLNTLGAMDGRVLCLALPPKPVDGLLATISAAALEREVVIADFSMPPIGDLPPPIRRGLDCAAVLSAGQDPVALAAAGPGAVRLCDWDGVARVAPGGKGGRLDVRGLAAALLVSAPSAPVVIDMRGLSNGGVEAAGIAVQAWKRARPGN